MDGAIFATGLALRAAVLVLCFYDVHLPHTFEALLVSPAYSRSIVLECAFRAARRLDTTELPCASHPAAEAIAWLLSWSGGAAGRRAPMALVALALAAQCASCGLVHLARRLSALKCNGASEADDSDDDDNSEEEDEGRDEGVKGPRKGGPGEAACAWSLRPTWRLLWIDPISIVAALASPLPFIVHLLVTLVWALPLMANALPAAFAVKETSATSQASSFLLAVAGAAMRLASLFSVLVLARCQAPWAAMVPSVTMLLCVEGGPGLERLERSRGSADSTDEDDKTDDKDGMEGKDDDGANLSVTSRMERSRDQGQGQMQEKGQGWAATWSWRAWALLVILSSASVLCLTVLHHWRSLAGWFCLSQYMEPTNLDLWALWPLSMLPPPGDARTTAAGSTSTSSHPPSAGVHWYLTGQVFSMLRAYFLLLFTGLPFVCAMPVCVQFAVGARMPVLAMHLMSALVLFFLPTTAFVDGMYALSLLCAHPRVVAKLRHLPVVMTGLAAGAWLSPTVLDLWVRRGSGNANFLFFQGLGMWLCAALGLSDFAASAVELEEEDEREGQRKDKEGAKEVGEKEGKQDWAEKEKEVQGGLKQKAD